VPWLAFAGCWGLNGDARTGLSGVVQRPSADRQGAVYAWLDENSWTGRWVMVLCSRIASAGVGAENALPCVMFAAAHSLGNLSSQPLMG
jgi:hypothetical protein